MRLLKVAGLLAFGAVGFVFADGINDPQVLFSKGGNHSTVVSEDCATITFGFCEVPIADAIVNGAAQLDVLAAATNQQAVVQIDFIIPTVNFDQLFVAESNLFTTAAINFNQEPGNGNPNTSVTFSGTGGTGPNAMASQQGPATTCEICAPGFEDGQNGNPNNANPNFDFFLVAFFGDSLGGAHPGLLPGQEGVLQLIPTDPGDSTVPEPGTFVMLISAVGLLVGGQKLRSRRTKA